MLYLTKHSRPDITNPVRQLSKSMDGASMAHVTEMYRVRKFVLEMKTLGLRMVPIFKDGIWKLEALSDSDFTPIKVQVDNVGAIWLVNNSSVSERTKHVDLRAHFVRDMIKDEVIEINFVKSAENDSDIMTNNQQGQDYMYAKS